MQLSKYLEAALVRLVSSGSTPSRTCDESFGAAMRELRRSKLVKLSRGNVYQPYAWEPTAKGLGYARALKG